MQYLSQTKKGKIMFKLSSLFLIIYVFSCTTMIDNEISITDNFDSAYLGKIDNVLFVVRSTNQIDKSITGQGWEYIETNFPERLIDSFKIAIEMANIKFGSIVLDGLELNEESRINEAINEINASFILLLELVEISSLADITVSKKYNFKIIEVASKELVFRANIEIVRMPQYGEGGLNANSAVELARISHRLIFG
jgi:hypothetical protein